MSDCTPYISVIIPAYNSANYITKCLDALKDSIYQWYEIILVDDSSSDNTADIAREMGCRVFVNERRSGPAVARNYGSRQAKGEIVLFIDSDVLVKKNTLEIVAATFSNNPDISALFGSYDDEPSERDFLSQYRNLLHHYIHQNSNPDAATFWAGCGAVRKNIFLELDGYDYKRFAEPSIEDIELGYRLREKGHKIRLEKNLQVTHLKHWSWNSMIKTDIYNRAVPWSRLILQTKLMPEDMNLRRSDRISTVLVGVLTISLLLLLFSAINLFSIFSKGVIASTAVAALAILIYLNRDLYGFFLEKRGLGFTLRVIPVHFLYYLYCGTSFGVCWIENKLGLLNTTKSES